MKAEFSKLVHHYPSGQKINAKLMSALINIDEEYIAVANGGSEIISLLAQRYRKQFILSPTFKEYKNRAVKPIEIHSLTEIKDTPNTCVVIVNPNNPDGSLIKVEHLKEVITKNSKCMFIIDESFMDFTGTNDSLLDVKNILEHENLLILKSIGKSHGIGGLRLGCLVGQKVDLI